MRSPIPAWLSTGVMQQPQDNRAGKLTMEQFNTLPEIKYMPNVDDSGGDCNGDDIDAVDENNSSRAANEEEEEVVDASKNQNKQAVVKKIDTEGDESSSASSRDDDEFPTTLAQNTTDVTDTESMETAEIVRSSPDTSMDGSLEATEDDLELGEAARTGAVKLKDKENVAAKASAPEGSATATATAAAAASDADNNGANNNADENNAQNECSPAESCSPASSSCALKKFKPTTSSMCSICIDDFEEGESLILLPRCQHAFHKDCIMPWLTERQGCCPMCKCNVLEEDDDDEEEAEEDEQDASDDDSDSTDETNANERHNNVALVEPEVVVAPPVPPEQSGTR
jgi:Ring finger domain